MKTSRIFRALALIHDERLDCYKRERKFRQGKLQKGAEQVNDFMLKLAEHEAKKLDAVRNALLACLAPIDTQPTGEEVHHPPYHCFECHQDFGTYREQSAHVCEDMTGPINGG